MSGKSSKNANKQTPATTATATVTPTTPAVKTTAPSTKATAPAPKVDAQKEEKTQTKKTTVAKLHFECKFIWKMGKELFKWSCFISS